MFFHKPCSYAIKADVSGSVKILAGFSIIGKFTAQITECSITKNRNSGKIPLVFYCERCERIVEDTDEIVCPCSSCGEVTDFNKIKVAAESGGIFCPSCIKRFDEKTYSICVRDIKFP